MVDTNSVLAGVGRSAPPSPEAVGNREDLIKVPSALLSATRVYVLWRTEGGAVVSYV